MFAHLQLAALAVAAAGSMVNARLPADCARNYTVKAGDTCNGISATQNVSTFQLAHVNPQINSGCTNLDIDEVLCLGIVGQDCTTVHVVNSSDTSCGVIAHRANTTQEILHHNNPNMNEWCTNIYVGEVLCTANTTIPYV